MLTSNSYSRKVKFYYLRKKPSKSNTGKFIIIGIGVAVTVGIAYAVVSGVEAPRAPEALHNQPIVMHIHPTLKIVIDGKSIAIPENIGIHPALYKSHDLDIYGMKNPRMSPLHTHDSSGVIHVESTEIRQYALGEFFDVWGVTFNENCIIDKCNDGTNKVRMYVDGKESFEFREYVLKDGGTITIEYGQ